MRLISSHIRLIQLCPSVTDFDMRKSNNIIIVICYFIKDNFFFKLYQEIIILWESILRDTNFSWDKLKNTCIFEIINLQPLFCSVKSLKH